VFAACQPGFVLPAPSLKPSVRQPITSLQSPTDHSPGARSTFVAVVVLLAVTALLGCATVEPRSEGCEELPPTPSSLRDAIRALEAWLPPADLATFKQTPESEATASAHFGFGMGLRNCWGLWHGSRLARHFNGLGIYHPDDMSGIILTSLWRHLNHEPLRVDEQVKVCREYWSQAAASSGGRLAAVCRDRRW
jgi:hypothetical protein